MSGFKRPEKPAIDGEIAAIDTAGEEMALTVRAEPVAGKPRRGAPVRVTRQNPRRVSIELEGPDFKRLQLLGIERGQKLQAMCEQAILDYLHKNETG